jgi:hypothetical protein
VWTSCDGEGRKDKGGGGGSIITNVVCERVVCAVCVKEFGVSKVHAKE